MWIVEKKLWFLFSDMYSLLSSFEVDINADITVTNLEVGELEALSFALKEHGFVYFC